jgi:hypothetical protein
MALGIFVAHVVLNEPEMKKELTEVK